MKLQILAVGRMKSGPERELYDRYADRIAKSGRSMHLAGPELIEIAESRKPNANSRKSEEAQELIARLGEGSRIVMLDERGKDLSSSEFSDFIRDEQEMGTSSLAFIIGGPDGHGDAMANAAALTIRLGKMTWPHQIARILLVEQIYRAITILSGHPYHRE